MNEKVHNADEDGARDVAETPLPSAPEAPRGPFGPKATFASPGNAGPCSAALPCPCGEYHSAEPVETPDPLGPPGSVYFGEDRICPGCGETCENDFCFCPEDCVLCEDIDLALEQFTFTLRPEDLVPGDSKVCWSPPNLVAFWEDDVLLVVDTQSEAKYRVMSCEEQTRAPASHYYTWFCERIRVLDPCTEDFMKAISS